MTCGFGSVTGQKKIISLLSNAIESGTVSHAYIFEGEPGMGKKTLARAFAQQLVCRDKNGCGNCDGCRLALSGNHPDIIMLTPSEGKQQISVENIRALCDNISLRPHSADKKVIIIPDCEKLNVSSQNALLKMLEEPPAYVVFVLITTNSNFFLDTVLSRSMKLTFEPYSYDEIYGFLQKNGLSTNCSAAISYAGGNLGKAFLYASDSSFNNLRELVFSSFKHLFGDKSMIYELVNMLEQNKDYAEEIFDIIESIARDLVMLNIGAEPVINNKDFSSLLEEYVSKTTLKGCMSFLENVINTKKMLLSNVNYNLLINSFAVSSREVLGW